MPALLPSNLDLIPSPLNTLAKAFQAIALLDSNIGRLNAASYGRDTLPYQIFSKIASFSIDLTPENSVVYLISSSAAVTATLASTNRTRPGQIIIFYDYTRNFGTYNSTIAVNGNAIDGTVSNKTLSKIGQIYGIICIAEGEWIEIINTSIQSHATSHGYGGTDRLSIPAIFNPFQEVYIWDDFLSGTNGGGAGWLDSVSGTGATISASNAVVDASHLGVYLISTGTTTTGRATFTLSTDSILVGGGVTRVDMVVHLANLSDATDEFTVTLGFGDNTGSGGNLDGVYFEYVRTTSVNWRANCRSNGSTTAITSSVPVSVGWVKLSFEINATGTSVEFFIDGSSIGITTTNIPTGAGRFVGPLLKTEKSAGTNARGVSIDLFVLNIQLTTSR
jgi:hypothetical protein